MKLKRLAAGIALMLVIGVSHPVLAEGLGHAQKPEDVGLSSGRLNRLTDRMKLGVEKGKIPGAVVAVARNGKIAYLQSFGLRDPESKDPMKSDAIFRIASMSKPFTSLAVMMLAEEGKLSIADPLSKYLPEFTDLKVGVVKPNAEGKNEVQIEPVRSPMTLQDLLRHTSGLTYGEASNNPLKQAYVDSRYEGQ